MVDPITAINTRALIGQEASGPSKSREASKAGAITNRDDNVETRKASIAIEQDALALNLPLGSTPEELQLSVSAVMERVSTALQERFGIAKDDIPEGTEGLPEEASAQEILDFFSPARTAERIVSFATGFFDAFLRNHEGEDEAENVDAFTTLIGDAIEEGFAEAEKMLGGSFEGLGETGETIQETYELVLKGLSEFRENKFRLLGEPENDSSDTTSPVVDDLSISAPSSSDGTPNRAVDLTA